ncbi:MAG TPA: hypothetical protein PKA06_02815, partial [Gemmatales bacterium]|nr:hypothetical protein [Gemmatales bacterium]
AARYYYLTEYSFFDGEPNQVWQVQGRGLVIQPPDRTELDQLVDNIKKEGLSGFSTRTPLGPDKMNLPPTFPRYIRFFGLG